MGSPHIVFAGGGSGGHLTPGIAVAAELKRRLPACEISFVTSSRGIDSRVLEQSSFQRTSIPMTPLQMRPGELLRFTTSFAASMRSLKRLWRATRPDLVVGLGGFTSVPAGLTAWRKGTPLVLLEQNVVPGRATALLSPLADRVCISFEETTRHLRNKQNIVVTGNPVRAEIVNERCNFSAASHAASGVLLVLGGSQGAAGINSMVLTAINRLRTSFTGWRIVHQTGERDVARVRAAYRQLKLDAQVAAYFDDLPQKYADARFVISRAGATSLAELACCGLPAILIPYPGSARNHQDRNAELFDRANAAAVVHEGAGAATMLAREMTALLEDPHRSGTMADAMRRLARPNAATSVTEVLLTQLAASSDWDESLRRAA